MKTLILYYSYSGNTKSIAGKKAIETDADIEEIIELKKPSMPVGIYRALKRKKTEIQPIKAQLDSYEKIIIMFPVWASFPVSAINSVIDCLPAGKKIEVITISGGGGTKKSARGTKSLITAKGCESVGYTDMKVTRKKNELSVKILD